jgi:hypothetical protein
MKIRLSGIILLLLAVMITSCSRPAKEPAKVKPQQSAPEQTYASSKEDRAALISEMTALKDKVDLLTNYFQAMSRDFAKLKTSSGSDLTEQVKKLDTDFTSMKEKVDSISDNFSSVSKDLNTLSARVDSMSNNYARLSSQVSSLEPSSAFLSTENEGYAIAGTQFGPFVITRRGVAPYQDGFRVKLGIGNLTAASFKGAKLRVTYGNFSSRDKKFTDEQSKLFNISDELSAGANTNVDIALSPVKAEDIKTIQVGLELSQMYLKTK